MNATTFPLQLVRNLALWLMRHIGFTLLVWVLWSPAASAQAALSREQIDEISQVAMEAIEQGGLPGLSIAVAKGDEVWTAAFGAADLELGVAATPESMFRTASVAKWFTAVAALRLVELGALELDAPIQRYCPHFPGKRWPITARQLLTHTSGVRHNYGSNGEPTGSEGERAHLDSLISIERATQYTRYTDVISPLETFRNDTLLFQPGTRAHYSSLGYRLLGCVLEGAGQRPYRQLMRELVFDPAGMQAIAEDDALEIIPNRVSGYSRDTSGTTIRAPFRDVSENLPAGGYLSTAEDLVRFVIAFNAGSLVDATSRELMAEQPILEGGVPAPHPMGWQGSYYGMGVMVDDTSEQPALFHTGGQSGTTALLYYFPSDHIVVGLMTNMDSAAIREPLARRIGRVAAN